MPINKHYYLIFILFILTLLFISSLLSGCISKPRRYPVRTVILSSDGNTLISEVGYSGGDAQIWVVSSGDELWRKYPAHIDNYLLSPHGEYFAISESKFTGIYNITTTIYNLLSGEKLISLNGYGHSWLPDDNYFILVNNHNKTIEIYDLENFTEKLTFSVDQTAWPSQEFFYPRLVLAFSSNGDKCSYYSSKINKIFTINVFDNGTYVWNISIAPDRIPNFSNDFLWSKDNKKFGFVCKNDTELKEHIIIVNSTNGKTITDVIINKSSSYKIISSDCTRLLLHDQNENNSLQIYNLIDMSRPTQTILLGHEKITALDWSYNEDIIVVGTESGIINIYNSTNGDIINILETKVHEGATPGFEFIFALLALFILCIMKMRQ